MIESRYSRRSFLKTAVVAGAGILTQQSSAWAATAAPRKAGRVRFGVQTMPQNVAFKDMAGVWREADDLGYDALFAFDHLMPIFDDAGGPCFEGWTLLASLAARTWGTASESTSTVTESASPATGSRPPAGGRLARSHSRPSPNAVSTRTPRTATVAPILIPHPPSLVPGVTPLR